MAFEDYFTKEVLGDARDIGAEAREFQRSIKFIRQDRYKAGVLFYINEIQSAANANNAAQAPSTTSTSGY